MSEPDWQSAPARRPRGEERRACVDTILAGSSALLAEARAKEEESLALGLSKVVSAASRLRELLESAGEGARRVGAVAPPPEAAAPRAASAAAMPLAEGEPGALLVVDDNPLNREMLVRRLAQKGYRVDEAEGGAQALDRIAAQRFDLVLLDIMMPGISGTEVLRRIRETHSVSDLPVIMATAKDSAEDVLECLKLGANDYVTKPLDFPIVNARVSVQLATKRAKEEAQRLARDLSASNRRLEEVQRRLVELQSGATGATEGLAAWTRTMADGIAPLVGVAEIGVFVLDDSGLHVLGSSTLFAPTMVEIESARRGPRERDVEGGARTVYAVLGSLGDLHGAVVVPARVSLWEETERQLLESFVKNLGTALDLQKVRGRLAEAEKSRAASRQEMIANGVDVLVVCPACRRCFSQATERCPDDGTPTKSPRLLPFRVASRYRLVRQLGEGGMGTVFEAQDERLERRVAIKILRNELFQDGEGLMRFEREARAVAGIDHPGVIKMYDSGDLSDGSAFLVMELLDGATLKDVLARDGRGTPRQVASLVRQGASALEAAHRAGILHRDVKPENFVCAPGEAGTFTVKLLDFGVAKTMEIESGVTRAGTVLGTPRYMSPEQVQDKPLDSRSDLYSFAVVAYEALTGVPVVADGALPRVMMDVAVKAPVPVSHHLKSLPKSVVAAFASALEKDADRRPATLHGWAATFVDDLEQLPADVPGWRFFRGDVDEGASTEPHIPALRRR